MSLLKHLIPFKPTTQFPEQNTLSPRPNNDTAPYVDTSAFDEIAPVTKLVNVTDEELSESVKTIRSAIETAHTPPAMTDTEEETVADSDNAPILYLSNGQRKGDISFAKDGTCTENGTIEQPAVPECSTPDTFESTTDKDVLTANTAEQSSAPLTETGPIPASEQIPVRIIDKTETDAAVETVTTSAAVTETETAPVSPVTTENIAETAAQQTVPAQTAADTSPEQNITETTPVQTATETAAGQTITETAPEQAAVKTEHEQLVTDASPAQSAPEALTVSETVSAQTQEPATVEAGTGTEFGPMPITVETFLGERGISIDLPGGKETIPPIESLAYTIAINYGQAKDFIRIMRECITKKRFDFTFNASNNTPDERIAIEKLASKLCEYGILTKYYYNRSSHIINATASSAPRCINFINGDFLEMYAKCVAIGVIKKLAEKYKCEYEFYNNVLIHKDNRTHELDMIFRLGDTIFWGEVKSGKFDPDEYRKLGMLMEVIPDRLIVFAADKSKEATEVISFLYEYFCANTQTFKSSLTEMIERAMEG